MTPDHLYAIVRLALAVWSTACLLFVTKGLALAYQADYGWPLRLERAGGWLRVWQWRIHRVRGGNGRSSLDRDVIAVFALLAVPVLLSAIRDGSRLLSGEVAEGYTWSDHLTTAYLVGFSIFAWRIWRKARREHLEYEGRPPRPITQED